jgi:hypothetical protein
VCVQPSKQKLSLMSNWNWGWDLEHTIIHRTVRRIWSTQGLWLACSRTVLIYVSCISLGHDEEPMLLVELWLAVIKSYFSR